MARYRGPRLRILRRLGAEHLVSPPKLQLVVQLLQVTAANRRFSKTSEHGLRLREKQSYFHYGLAEKQLRLIYEKAKAMPGDTGRNIINLLESRLDNLVWRAGFTRTIPAARQLVAHGHVNISGKRAKTPSQHIKVGQGFILREKCLQREDLRLSANNPVSDVPPGIVVDLDKLAVTVEALPSVEQCPIEVDIQKVIEFYSK